MFTGRNNFSLCKRRMKDISISKGLKKEWNCKMPNEDREELEEKEASAIRLTLHKDVFFNIMEIESTSGLCAKLESIYMVQTSCFWRNNCTQLNWIKMFHSSQKSRSNKKTRRWYQFLSSLSPSYEHLVTTLMYGKETLEMNEVTAALT